MSSLSLLTSYDKSDGSDEDQPSTSGRGQLRPLPKSLIPNIVSLNKAKLFNLSKSEREKAALTVDPLCKELTHNATYEQMFKAVEGPTNPYKSEFVRAQKNTLTGFVEPAHFNEFRFEAERKTFDTFGYAVDPTAREGQQATKYVGDQKEAEESKGETVFESKKTGKQKRKMVTNWDPTDLEGYTGPWGKYVDEKLEAKPDEDTLKEMEEFKKKRKKYQRLQKSSNQETNQEEKSVLHIKDTTDYQGRGFLHAPQDTGVNLRADHVPDKCFIPKKQLHEYKGHTKGVQCIRWFPGSAHLLLSASMDTKIKLWEVYKGRRCVRTYAGHKMAVRDVNFNNDGSKFLSASFDRMIKLWDTETGQCVSRYTTNKVPFTAVFNPDPDKQHFFLSGMQDKKVIQWDTRTNEIIQEYDRHLGAVNTITFFYDNKRFATTSDDKSLRIWEWEIPVDTKLIQDSSLHSMPFMRKSPNEKWIVGQAMDNRIVLFQLIDDKLRFAKKKAFRGHMTAGYACGVDWSPDMSYLISGDSAGKLFIWDWKTHRIVARWKAHDQVCISCLWHPHETSKIVTCSWDNTIKLWD